MGRFKQAAAIILIMAAFIAIHLYYYPQRSETGGFSSALSPQGERPSQPEGDGLTLTVLDVGQGLCVIAQSGGQTLLYDGGDREHSSKVVAYLKSQGVSSLDYLVASHYDADHLSGLIGALNAFPVLHAMGPDYSADSSLFESFRETLGREGLELSHPVPGGSWQLGDARVTVLAPLGSGYEDENDYSLVLRLESSGRSVLLMGDATSVSESEMLAGDADLESNLLVIGHHGSATSTGREFLNAVSPQAAIISCQKGNPYGHPDEEVMGSLKSGRIRVYRTDLQGDLSFHISKGLVQNGKAPCNDYSPGNPAGVLPIQGQPGQGPGRADGGYVLNTHSKKFHLPSCGSVEDISPRNYQASWESMDSLIAQGYAPCQNCSP